MIGAGFENFIAMIIGEGAKFGEKSNTGRHQAHRPIIDVEFDAQNFDNCFLNLNLKKNLKKL